jgi:protein-tyrosine-phosphatase/DNA-binding transcriptional ArsR family regulator
MMLAVASASLSAWPDPPVFWGLAADPVRWRLLTELGRGDRRVSELCALLDRPQNLVSYHLGKLRGAGLVRSHRSAADGRDSYYTLDLARCAELLARSGAELHPALPRRAAPPHATREPAPPRARLLFLCTGNSARSQMAEALAESLSGGAVEAFSAGSQPKPVHPNAVRVMAERGLQIAGRRSKHLDELGAECFDSVVSLCDRVREVCPEFPGHPELIHWSVLDPARQGATEAETYTAFRRTADELAERITFLLERMAAVTVVSR